MIEYEKRFLFLNFLFWTSGVGSSLPRSSFVCAFSAGFHVLMYHFLSEDFSKIVHPYAIGVFATIVAFYIIFRSNSASQRYQEAAGTTHQMLSKWGDCALQCSAFYQQSSDAYKSTDEGMYFVDNMFHFFSLMVASAFLSLRRDDEMNYTTHAPGTLLMSTCGWTSRPRGFMHIVYAFRMRASKKIRAPYNCATKMPVIGGVSERELAALKNGLGTGTSTMVCMHWLCEYLARAHLEGAFGNVPAPVVSRLTQELSDGMLGFNHARKIAYLPFPFPHAQVAELFLLLLLFLIPLLMVTFVKNAVLGPVFSFFACLSFCALYEATRDLEDPFIFEPNDLPLPVWLTHFNESLLALKLCGRTPSPHLDSAKVLAPSDNALI